MIILEKIAAGISAIMITVAGFFGFAPKADIANDYFGAYYPVAGGVYTLKGSGIGTSDSTIILTSFTEPVSARELAMADFGSIGYATIDPGTSKKEFISFTGVTQDGSTAQATLTGVVRGLGFTYPYTSSSSLAKSHSGGAKLIISNPPQHYEQYANLSRTQTISAVWTYNSSSIPKLDSYFAPTNDAQFAPKKYVDDVAIASAPIGTWSTAGIYILATTTNFVNGSPATTTGNYYLVPPASFFSSSSAANKGVVANASGKVDQGFLNLSESWTLSGTLNLTGTTTLSGTTTFSVIPSMPTSSVSTATNVASVYYVDHTINIPYFSTSTNLKASANTESTSTAGTWQKKKEITVRGYGIVRVAFDIKADTPASTTASVYINGTATGTVATSSSSYLTFYRDITVQSADEVQLYIYTNASGTNAWVRNFQLYYDITGTTTSYSINQD